MSSCVQSHLEDNHPEAYIELLKRKPTRRICDLTTRVGRTKRLGSFQDDKLSQRFSQILDVLARACIARRGEVATTAASIMDNGADGVKTTIYISHNGNYNGQLEDIAERIRSIFNALRSISAPQETVESSSAFLAVDQPALIETSHRFLVMMYDFGWDLWQYYLSKRMEDLLVAAAVVDETQTKLTAKAEGNVQTSMKELALTEKECEEMSTLLSWIKGIPFLLRVDGDEKLTAPGLLGELYEHWVDLGYICREEDEAASGPRASVLDKLEKLVFEKRRLYFPLKRWLAKITSFHAHALRLFRLARSRRLQPILQGLLRVVVVPIPTTVSPSLIVHFDEDTVRATLAAVRQEYRALTTCQLLHLDDPELDPVSSDFCGRFFGRGREPDEITRQNTPYVHLEVCLLHYLEEQGVDCVPYFGISKLMCMSCMLYFQAFVKVTGRHKIETRGTHGKYYPPWLMPPSDTNGIREEMVHLLRQELANHFLDFVERERERKFSNSSAGSVQHASTSRIHTGRSLNEFKQLIQRLTKPPENAQEKSL